jgi:localization factor PodJL
MSDTGSDDQKKLQAAKPKPSEAAPHCAAEDLREILSHITKQIADADRRHSSALTDMQSRLIGLGGKAETVRSRVPEEYAPAFQRIEDGVALLADRIAEAGRERKIGRTSGGNESSGQPEPAGYSLAHDGFIPASAQEIVRPRTVTATVTSIVPEVLPVEVFAVEAPVVVQAADKVITPVTVEAPVVQYDVPTPPPAPSAFAASVALSALASTSSLAMAAVADSDSHKAAPVATSVSKSEPKPFAAHMLNLQMAARSAPTLALLDKQPANRHVDEVDADSPWDAASAAALTELYHPTAPTAAVTKTVDMSEGKATTDEAVVKAAAEGKATREEERRWLEARFADIAARVDMLQAASVDQVKARSSLAEERGWLDARFAELMSRVQTIQANAAQVATARTSMDAERKWLEQRFADMTAKMQTLTSSVAANASTANQLVDGAAIGTAESGAAQVQEQVRISLEAERQWIEERFADLTKRVEALKTADPVADQAKADAERDWLEDRFADITARVEQLQAVGADTASARANLDAERQWLEARFADITRHVTDQVSSQMQSFVQPTVDMDKTAADQAAEHDWLEAKFADLAERVQISLDDMRQDNSLVSLDQRFDQFEQRLGDALDDMATRPDADSLKQVETHIGDLVTQLEQARGQLGRLEQIEGNLTELMSRVSDERLGELMGQAGPSPTDIENVATAVADRIVTRMPQPAKVDMSGFDDLRGLIQNFVEDQRQGEEHTASMLDTMQQAMIRVLDRMDALESGHTTTPKLAFNTAPNPQPVQAPSPMPAAAMPHNIAGERQPPTNAAITAMTAAIANVAATATVPNTAAATVGAKSPQPNSAAATVAATRRNLMQQQPPATDDEPEMTGGKPFAPGAKTPAVDPAGNRGGAKREDFIAGARRAARQGVNATPTPNIADDDADDEALASRFGVKGKGEKDGSKLRPTLMVAAVTGLVAVGLLAATVTVYKNQGAVVTQRANAPVLDQQSLSGGVQQQSDRVDVGRLPGGSNLDQLSDNSDQTVVGSLRQDAQLILQDGQSEGAAAQNGQALNGETIEGQVQDGPAVLNGQGLPFGISVVQTNSLPTEQAIVRARQQQQMAALSSKAGQTQAQAQSIVQAQYQAQNVGQSAIPTALAQPSAKSADMELSSPTGNAATMTELPPAFVGPMSLRVAAAKGDPSAAFEVAARLAEGRGINQDFAGAITWYQRSAQRGFAPAQYRLGTLYERGIGIKADLPRAKIWYARAAEQGNVKAMHNLAVLSAGRDAEATDYATASKWFTGAAQHGLADSQYNLGVLYESGLGVQRDAKQAYLWLSLAARGGDKEAGKRRDVVRATMAPQDARDAEAMVASWRAQPVDRANNDALVAGEAWKARQNLRQPG